MSSGLYVDPRYDGWMARALDLAATGTPADDVPVAALVFGPDGTLLGQGVNRRAADADPTAHAEIVAIRAAAVALGRWRLDGSTLVSTLEPCVMCAGALVASRVARLVIGAWDDKAGACGSVWDLVRSARATHRVEVTGGVRAAESAALLRAFFAGRRQVGPARGLDR